MGRRKNCSDEKGCRGPEGPRGCKGAKGCRGPEGEIGPTGPAGSCECQCVCISKTVNFVTNPGVQFTELESSRVFGFPGSAYLIAHGFTNDGDEANLSSRGTQGPGEEGLGVWDDCFEDIHELDNQHFIQLDVSDLIKYYNYICDEPTITIGSVQQGEGFELGGTNTLGEFGTQLFTYLGPPISKTVSLFNPGGVLNPVLYKYISVRAYPGPECSDGGDVVLENVTINVCEFNGPV